MKAIRKGPRQAFLLLLAVIMLVACDTGPAVPTATTSANKTPAANMTTVRIGYIPVMIFAPLFVAIERGYFAKEGIEVKLTPLQGGSDAVVQLAAGNFDAAIGGAGAGLFNAANRGVKFTIVAPMHSERPPVTSPLVISAKRTDITKISDLKGKKVAVNATGAATEYWLAKALAREGVKIEDVQLQTVPFSNVPAALENGSLDASILGEPLVTINEDKGIVKVLSEDFIDNFYSTYLYFGDPLIKEKPEVARGFLKAYLQACRDLQGNYMNDDIAAIIEKYTQVPAGVVKRASLPQFEPNGRIPVDNITTLQDYFASRGLLDYTTKLDVARFINSELAREAASELDAGK
ncbi:MAG: NitT/TauT family transport system substrate-binding protein [Chloroflexia bacterium]|nr:NitT/TauT family transport system substrate-binding protein [Chloroflexia bacterium]